MVVVVGIYGTCGCTRGELVVIGGEVEYCRATRTSFHISNVTSGSAFLGALGVYSVVRTLVVV